MLPLMGPGLAPLTGSPTKHDSDHDHHNYVSTYPIAAPAPSQRIPMSHDSPYTRQQAAWTSPPAGQVTLPPSSTSYMSQLSPQSPTHQRRVLSGPGVPAPLPPLEPLPRPASHSPSAGRSADHSRLDLLAQIVSEECESQHRRASIDTSTSPRRLSQAESPIPHTHGSAESKPSERKRAGGNGRRAPVKSQIELPASHHAYAVVEQSNAWIQEGSQSHTLQRQHRREDDNPDDWFLGQTADGAPYPSATALPSALESTSQPPSLASKGQAAKGATGSKNKKKKGKEPTAKLALPSEKTAVPTTVPDADVDAELLSMIEDVPAEQNTIKPLARDRPPMAVDDWDALLMQPSPAQSDRGSMPPPPDPKEGEKKKAIPPPKPKLPGKRQSKPSAKVRAAKEQNAAASSAPTPPLASSSSRGKKGAKATDTLTPTGAGSRSRSTSVMPTTNTLETQKPAGTPLPPDSPDEDDRLYCICQEMWDENSVMIGCDVCEGWYHPRCIQMPEHCIDLVDQFVCPSCASDPADPKRTTWKRRCLMGLSQPNPSEPSSCHKPARPDGSKFCSDECGVAYMQRRIDAWVASGGNRAALWESVKGAQRREGIVTVPLTASETRSLKSDENDAANAPPPAEKQKEALAKQHLVQPAQSRTAREVAKLNSFTTSYDARRTAARKEMELVEWRTRVLALASDRAEHLDECGWDQRLCFSDEEIEELGAAVVASYSGIGSGEGVNSEKTEVEEMGGEEEGDWWCREKRKCRRHTGWQKLRKMEVDKSRTNIEEMLAKLASRERDARARIEDLLAAPPTPSYLLSSRNGDINGRSNSNGRDSKRGKKRKAA